MFDDYVFNLKDSYSFNLDVGVFMPLQKFRNKSGNVVGMCKGRTITIMPGYSWNGCSPRLKIGAFVLGTSNGPSYTHYKEGLTHHAAQLFYASLEHDFLYQFKPEGTTRLDADKCFLSAMLQVRWKYAKLYYLAVRIFGIF